MNTLIIVESPTKARKIQKYFNDGTIVKSSFGHIFDLPKNNISIDVNNNFKPNYQPIPGKEKIIKELYNLRKNHILLAADDDREGDAIAWHCGNLLKVNYNENNRIIFHEISKKSINEAILNPVQINMNSVNSQQARRIIDRLVGFNLSPLLWKHIDSDQKGLSAGRVQSTLLKILKDKMNEITNFQSQLKDDFQSEFRYNENHSINCEFISNQKVDPLKFLNLLKENKIYHIQKIDNSQEKKYAPLTFITSSLQQTAYKELGFPVKKTMNIAQKLFENGKITYMRTDSHSISYGFQIEIKNNIFQKYGENYYKSTHYNKKVKGAQEAHECIRITKIDDNLSEKYDKDDHKLYNLIKKRTIISHMQPIIYDVLTINLINEKCESIGFFKGINKNIIFDGYLKYDNKDVTKSEQLEIKNDTSFTLEKCIYQLKESFKPHFYNESSIIKILEKSGIGRPSTYSSIISTLYNRNYTETKTIKNENQNIKTLTLNKSNQIKESFTKQTVKDQKNSILLTELGEKVLEYLSNHFSNIINEKFTATVENDLDKITNGEIDWIEVIQKVYNSFYKDVQIQMKLSSKNTKKNNHNDINIGQYENNDITLKKGPYGYYLNYNDKNINLKNHIIKNKCDPLKLKLNDIQYLLDYPMELGKYNKSKVTIFIGPYGKYMKYKNKNIKIPQKDKYTLDECIRIIEK